MQNDDWDVVYYCKNCYNLKDCWCNNKDYVEMWEFVYKAMKSLNPV